MIATHEHATDRPHNAPVAQRFELRGRFATGRFLAFLANHAAWLSIDGWAMAPAAGRITVVAAGPEAMVGAFEMAMMLGPADALVEDIASFDEPSEIPEGFTLPRVAPA